MNKLITTSAIISGLCFFFTGCAAQAPLPRVFWPIDEPKIEWLNNYYGEDSFPQSSKDTFISDVTGGTQSLILSQPVDAVSDSVGNIFVTDIGRRNIFKFDFTNFTADEFLPSGLVERPSGMAIDSKDQIYIADSADSSVKVVTTQGIFIKKYKSQDHFVRPAYIALNERLNRLYVSDAEKSHIVVFDLDGEYLFNVGSEGAGEGEFYAPQGIAINANDEIFVADTLHSRIQAFDSEGTFIRAFGEIGDQVYQFERPKDLAFDSEGNLHIVDDRKGMHLIYSPEGTLLLANGGDVSNNYTLGMSTPKGIFIDKDDRVIVVDTILKRFMLFQFFSEKGKAKNPITPADIQYLQKMLKENKPTTE